MKELNTEAVLRSTRGWGAIGMERIRKLDPESSYARIVTRHMRWRPPGQDDVDVATDTAACVAVSDEALRQLLQGLQDAADERNPSVSVEVGAADDEVVFAVERAHRPGRFQVELYIHSLGLNMEFVLPSDTTCLDTFRRQLAGAFRL